MININTDNDIVKIRNEEEEEEIVERNFFFCVKYFKFGIAFFLGKGKKTRSADPFNFIATISTQSN